MSHKNGLLSIGEMAKLTGAGIQALRYYERKNILKPAYTDPDSGYRYYSLNQVNFVALIMNCVEFGIPLKELTGVIEADDMAALARFMERSKDAIHRKSRVLKLAADAFEKALEKIETSRQYKTGQIYRQEYEEKYYYVKPYGPVLGDKNILGFLFDMGREIYGEHISRPAEVDDIEELAPLPDVGYLCRHSQGGVSYYGLVEMTKRFVHENTITIPKGAYYFRHDETSKIETAPEIFREQLHGKDSFMIIETEETFLSNTKVSQTMYELRLIL